MGRKIGQKRTPARPTAMHYGLGVTGKKNPRQATKCGLNVPEANARRAWKGVTCLNCLRVGKRLVQPVAAPASPAAPE